MLLPCCYLVGSTRNYAITGQNLQAFYAVQAAEPAQAAMQLIVFSNLAPYLKHKLFTPHKEQCDESNTACRSTRLPINAPNPFQLRPF
jgi:hypothetical protein